MKQIAAVRALAFAISTCVSLAAPAQADSCRDQIVALFDGGAPNALPADLEAFHKTTRDQLARNVTAPTAG